MTRRALKIGLGGLLTLSVCVVGLVLSVLRWPDFGGDASGERLARMERSAQWAAASGGFANDPPPPPYDLGISLREILGDQVRSPPGPLPSRVPVYTDPPEPGLRATWFGHATVLVEIDGRRAMTDPILSERAFPVKLIAPQRSTPPPLALAELPAIDVVTISHDHFDHLDMATVQHLAAKGTHFFVGLGVGAHLARWGVPADQIHELDWWESDTHAGLTVHCVPARHYSGRKSLGNPTLWASWVIEGPAHRVYHSGDSGYAGHFREIGERQGPIDLALIKIGDYGADPAWESIHMVPEDSVRASVDLGAKTMLPIHWATFELSYHDWDEPIRRAMNAAGEQGVQLVTPRVGEVYRFGEPFSADAWWEAMGTR